MDKYGHDRTLLMSFVSRCYPFAYPHPHTRPHTRPIWRRIAKSSSRFALLQDFAPLITLCFPLDNSGVQVAIIATLTPGTTWFEKKRNGNTKENTGRGNEKKTLHKPKLMETRKAEEIDGQYFAHSVCMYAVIRITRPPSGEFPSCFSRRWGECKAQTNKRYFPVPTTPFGKELPPI